MIKVELAFTTVAEAAAFFVAASGAAPVSPLPAIVEPPAPAPKAQHQRPPTEPKITVPNASSAGASVSGESKTGAQPSGPAPGEAGKAAAAAAPAGATAAASTAAAPAGSSQAGAPAFDRKIVSQDMVRLAGKNMAKAGELLEAYGVKRQKDLTDEQAAEIHPKILAALGE